MRTRDPIRQPSITIHRSSPLRPNNIRACNRTVMSQRADRVMIRYNSAIASDWEQPIRIVPTHELEELMFRQCHRPRHTPSIVSLSSQWASEWFVSKLNVISNCSGILAVFSPVAIPAGAGNSRSCITAVDHRIEQQRHVQHLDFVYDDAKVWILRRNFPTLVVCHISSQRSAMFEVQHNSSTFSCTHEGNRAFMFQRHQLALLRKYRPTVIKTLSQPRQSDWRTAQIRGYTGGSFCFSRIYLLFLIT